MFKSTFNDCHYISDNDVTEIIDAWRQMIVGHLIKGWDAYLVSVLFHEIAGSKDAKKVQMVHEIERIYNRLATRMVRKTWAPEKAQYLPIGIFLPDLPVPKLRSGVKSTIADVSINDGLHMGGILLTSKKARIDDLEAHFEQEKDVYISGKVRSIGIRHITHDVDKPVDYTFKSLKRRTCTLDDVLVLNWGGTAALPLALRRWKQCCDYVQSARGAAIRKTLEGTFPGHLFVYMLQRGRLRFGMYT